MDTQLTNAQLADHYRTLELNYRERAKELQDMGQFTGAVRLVKEADICQNLYFKAKRRMDGRYTLVERILLALGFTL